MSNEPSGSNFIRDIIEADLDANKLVSALSQYGMRCKVQTNTVRVWSDDGKPQTLPPTIRNRHANATVQLSGVWHTQKQSGLSMQLMDIDFVKEADPNTRSRATGLARWDGGPWVLDATAIDHAAKTYLENRIKCRDRKRAIRATLAIYKPRLFSDRTKLTDCSAI